MNLEANIERPQIDRKIYLMRDTGMSYKVLKYDDKYVCDNDEEMGKYRSVIFSEPEEKLLCYSPPKSITMDLFYMRNTCINATDIMVTEIKEGIMISLFWDDRINGWELASKGAVGGNYWFFRTQYNNTEKSQKTFRDMFLEAFRVTDLKSVIFEELPKGKENERICYNFVLQHPDNHIVLSILRPRIYLVSVYLLNSNTNSGEFITSGEFISPEVYRMWRVFDNLSSIIEFPEEITEYSDEYDMGSTPGLMFLNTSTGDRACLENPRYAELKELRGNNPNLHYQYLCLRRISKVDDFLGHFPQYKNTFHRFFNQFESFVKNVHQAYMDYYITKISCDNENNIYLPVIHKLHYEVYLPSLQTEKIIMRKTEVRKQLLQFAPSVLFHYLYVCL